jgi:uncharacterized protein DUF6894
MPIYRFHVRQGKFSGAPCIEAVLEDREAAWLEAAEVCADLARDVIRGLKAEPQWLMEVTDGANAPLFKFRFVAEISPASPRSTRDLLVAS